MGVPVGSNFPGALDDDTTLFGDPTNQVILTLAADIDAAQTTFQVNEAITNINIPTFFVFATGEIVYAEAKTDGTKTFSSVTRNVDGSGVQSHLTDEELRQGVVKQYVSQSKDAVIAIETALGANLDNVVEEADHTKAAHDAMNIDADTLDGLQGADYVEDADHTKALHDGLDIDADTVDNFHAAGLMKAGLLTILDGGELTISGGAVTVSGPGIFDIDTEADAATDDLDTINGGTAGDIIVFRAEDAARTVVVKYDTGNIQPVGGYDCPLANQNQLLVLRYNGTKWVELAGGMNRLAIFGYSLGQDEQGAIPSGVYGDLPIMPALYLLGIYAIADISGSITISLRNKGSFGVPIAGDEVESFVMTTQQTKSDTTLTGVTREQLSGTWRFITDGAATSIEQVAIVAVAVVL